MIVYILFTVYNDDHFNQPKGPIKARKITSKCYDLETLATYHLLSCTVDNHWRIELWDSDE